MNARDLGRRALTVLIILAVPLLMIRLFQDSLLYYPERASRDDYLRIAAGAGLSAWPDADNLRGLVADPPAGLDAAVAGTVAVLHGNAGNAAYRDYYVPVLTQLGYRVVLLEYPGYGSRTGKVGEASLVADAVESLRLLHRQSPLPLILIGESLGAGVAAATAGQAPDALDALMLITPWDKLASVAQHHYPWAPVRLMLRDRYDSAVNLRAFPKPITLVVAEHDEIIPPVFARQLFEAIGTAGGRNTLVTIGGAAHNDWAWRIDKQWWRSQLAALRGAKDASNPLALPLAGE